MHMDPLLQTLVGIIFVILTLASLLRRLRQPFAQRDRTSSTAQFGSQREPDGLRERMQKQAPVTEANHGHARSALQSIATLGRPGDPNRIRKLSQHVRMLGGTNRLP